MRILKITLLMFALTLLFACNPNAKPNVTTLNTIGILFNIETKTYSATDIGYQLTFVEETNFYQLTIALDDYYEVNDDVVILINGIVIEDGLSIEENIITYTFNDLDLINPNSYKDIQVTLDLNGGFLTNTSLGYTEPDAILTITTYDDILGKSLTVFDSSYQTLRWFYKLYIAYNASYGAYEVVFSDPATKANHDLNLPAYDYIIAVHSQTEDITAKETIIYYTQNFESPMLITFDQDLSLYQSGDMIASFYTKDSLGGVIELIKSTPDTLPIPYKEGFTFLGWQTGGSFASEFVGFKRTSILKQITYTAIWEGATLNDYISYLDQIIPSSVNSNIDLPQSYSGFKITWTSSHPDIISEAGIFKKPYQTTSVTLTASTTHEDSIVTRTYEIETIGYKSLDGPIASSYIYRNYSSVTDTFFETLDIINTAFIIGQSDATLTGANYLYNVATHIMPKARIHGNWVIMSVAPESSWSVIAANQTLVERFADNIVSMINQYGFDGVDIDWETPTNAERTRFTNLMRVVYEKVKTNNPNHLVTTAITGGMWQPPQYDLLNSLQYLDYINMMTYGMTSSNGYYQNALYRSTTYHHPQFLAGRTLTSCSIEESIDIFHLQYQVPYHKIIVGVAFYGIRQTRTYNSQTQTWSTWTNAGSVFYNDIITNFLSNDDYIKAYDRYAGVPYILKTDGTVFISYDNPRSIEEKGAYIIEKGLGGMMFWEYGTDTTGTLLNALGNGLNK